MEAPGPIGNLQQIQRYVEKMRRALNQLERHEDPEPLQDVVKFMKDLDDNEIVRAVIVEILFPKSLLHLDQFGERESRSRLDFEEALVTAMENHWITYNHLKNRTSKYIHRILQHPDVRTRLYMKYMATPPEGLYERVDPACAIPPGDFADMVRLANYPRALNRRGRTTKQLVKFWYGDYLATVAYNEWQRAISLSTARAIQLFFWLYRPSAALDTPADFLEYWGFQDLREGQRRSLALEMYFDSQRLRFKPKGFPLTYDTDTYLLFGTHLGSVRGDVEEAFRYQSIIQPRIERMQENPTTQLHILPESGALSRVFQENQIEIVRALRFRNTPVLERIEGGMLRNLDPHIEEAGLVDIRLAPPLRIGSPKNYGALVVGRPYDLAVGFEPGSYYPGGGFVPWAAEVISLDLGNIGVDRITGMHRAVRDLAVRPDRTAFMASSTEIEALDPTVAIWVDQTGLSLFNWTLQHYIDSSDAQRGPLPLPDNPSL